MQRPSKKLTKTVDHKLMKTQDLNYVQLKLNIEQKVLLQINNLSNKTYSGFYFIYWIGGEKGGLGRLKPPSFYCHSIGM